TQPDSESRRKSLAAFEFHEDRIERPDQRSEADRRQHLRWQPKASRQKHRHKALEHVTGESKRSRRRASSARDIAHADVARANRARVEAVDAADGHAHRDRSDQVGDGDQRDAQHVKYWWNDILRSAEFAPN